MAGYNPYRKENGEFASKDELGGVESKVEADLTAARSADDSERVDEIERYAMDKLPESKLGKSLLEARYGAAPAPTTPKPSVSTEERYGAMRESLRAVYYDENGTGADLAAARDRIEAELKTISDSELAELSTRSIDVNDTFSKGTTVNRAVSYSVAEEVKRRNPEGSPSDERYESIRAELSTGETGYYDGASRDLGFKLEKLSDGDLEALRRHANAQLARNRPGSMWDVSVRNAATTEQRRRTHRESFETLTSLGYEHDGRGRYSLPGAEQKKYFFVAARGENPGLSVSNGRDFRKINSTEELLAEAGGAAKPSSARIPQNIAAELKAAGVKRPMNWDEMGSSAKDRWEEAQYKALNR